MPPCARVPRSRSPSDKRASLSQLRASIPPRIPSFDANRKLFREKIWKRDPRRRWNRVRSDRLSVSFLKSALPPSLSLSHFFSFSSELESERFLVENRRRLERVRSVIGFSESEECSSQSSDRSLSASEESFRDDSSLTVQY